MPAVRPDGLEAPRVAPVAPRPAASLWARIRAGYALPRSEHPAVGAQIARLARDRRHLAEVAERARPFLYLVVQEVARRRLPMELALLPMVESGYRPLARSAGGAAGLWQFVPLTGRHYGLAQNWWYDGRDDVLPATRAALHHLRRLHERFDRDWLLAIAAYNCGEGAVARAMRRNREDGRPAGFWHLRLPRETRDYVPRLLAVTELVAHPERYGIRLPEIPGGPRLARIDTGGQLDLGVAARLAGLPLERLRALNPALKRGATNPDGPHALLVPIEHAERLRKALDELPPGRRMPWRVHRVVAGETLGGIAHRYGIRVPDLQRDNGLSGTRIRAGRYLRVALAGEPALEADSRPEAKLAARASKPSETAVLRTYRVRPGDSLWRIARRFDLHVRDLQRWNGLASNRPLRIGQGLTLGPAGRTSAQEPREAAADEARYHTVRPGESLWRISRRFGVSVAALRRWNDLSAGTDLRPGQRLELYPARSNEDI